MDETIITNIENILLSATIEISTNFDKAKFAVEFTFL